MRLKSSLLFIRVVLPDGTTLNTERPTNPSSCGSYIFGYACKHDPKPPGQNSVENMRQSKRGKLDGKIQILQWCTFDPGFRPDLLDGTFKHSVKTFSSLTQNKRVKDVVILSRLIDPLRGLYHHYQLKTSD